ncbi:MAG: hypothetical protein EHM48_03105, partial [Planctomycetaceae bacterium]
MIGLFGWHTSTAIAGDIGAASQPASRTVGSQQGVLVLDDFEAGLNVALRADNAKLAVSPDAPPGGGKACLAIRITNPIKKTAVLLPLPAGTDMSKYASLRAWVRLDGPGKTAAIRWLALDENKNVIRQQRFQRAKDSQWASIDWPLAMWRWGDKRIGEWADVRYLALMVEEPAERICLDDIALSPPTATMSADDWLTKLAFPDGAACEVNQDGFRLACDAPEMSAADLRYLAGQMSLIRKWVRRTIGQADKPVLASQPITFLIFRDNKNWQAFYDRLGQAWDVNIPLPPVGGYTIEDISAATYDPKQGRHRPVYLHEAVHAILARQARLPTGNPDSEWLHEGLANYLQICLQPESADLAALAANFRNPIDSRSFIRPLREIVGKKVSPRHYAQLAVLTAFLIDKHPEWLQKFIAGSADGKPPADTLKECGTTLDDMEAEWLTWCRGRFATTQPTTAPAIFGKPVEWSPASNPAASGLGRTANFGRQFFTFNASLTYARFVTILCGLSPDYVCTRECHWL